ncbi:MAG: hypothetical protein ACFFBP_16205 [Promethearchaeota archaeon]
MTIYIVYAGTSFIAIFSITLYFEIKANIDTTKVQIIYLIILSALYLVIFIPGGVVINKDTNWFPVVNSGFFIYCTVLINLSLTIFIVYSIKTLKIFKRRNESKILMNRWKIYIIGIIETFAFASITMLVHLINIIQVRDIWAVIGGVLFITGIYFTWYGIGKKFL